MYCGGEGGLFRNTEQVIGLQVSDLDLHIVLRPVGARYKNESSWIFTTKAMRNDGHFLIEIEFQSYLSGKGKVYVIVVIFCKKSFRTRLIAAEEFWEAVTG